MLRKISEPLSLSEASLLVLRPTMNAPVLNVEFLPVGPARAAVVVFAEEYGGYGLALGIRSNEGGQVAVFRNREPMDDSVPIAEVLEPALAHAERMGFLFDEDMVAASPGEKGRAQAKALWGRLTGEIELPPAPRAAPPLPAATEPILELDAPLPGESGVPELILDLEDEAAAPIELPLDQVVPTPGAAPAAADAGGPRTPAPTASQAKMLSKFRQGDPSTSSTSSTRASNDANPDGPSELGRIPLVRVRRGKGRGADHSKRIPYLARLLSSF